MVVSQDRGPQCRPQNTRIPRKVPPSLGNSQMTLERFKALDLGLVFGSPEPIPPGLDDKRLSIEAHWEKPRKP